MELLFQGKNFLEREGSRFWFPLLYTKVVVLGTAPLPKGQSDGETAIFLEKNAVEKFLKCFMKHGK